MPRRPPLTQEEHRTIRDWSFAMAAIYSMILLALLASAIVHGGPAPSVADTAAAETRQDAAGTISSGLAPRPLTEASMQQ
jgi:hypothetical protein